MITNGVLGQREEFIARLTQIAYQAVLQSGYRGSFLDLELTLWREVRRSVELTWPVDVTVV